jgi:predicted lipoprotein with Yx(FWY)xxD motif
MPGAVSFRPNLLGRGTVAALAVAAASLASAPAAASAAHASLASAPAAASAAHATTIALAKTKAGSILVDSRGYTVYAFTKDTRNHDACVGIRACLTLWPAITTTGKVAAGPGVKASLLGTIKFHGAKRQLTYAGHPLYGYTEDTHPGQTSNINILQFQGRWPALNAAGGLVK